MKDRQHRYVILNDLLCRQLRCEAAELIGRSDFNLFEHAMASSKTKSGAGGTGLGLAICQRILQDQGGHVWAGNLPSRGARFSFILPRVARAVCPAPCP